MSALFLGLPAALRELVLFHAYTRMYNFMHSEAEMHKLDCNVRGYTQHRALCQTYAQACHAAVMPLSCPAGVPELWKSCLHDLQDWSYPQLLEMGRKVFALVDAAKVEVAL